MARQRLFDLAWSAGGRWLPDDSVLSFSAQSYSMPGCLSCWSSCTDRRGAMTAVNYAVAQDVHIAYTVRGRGERVIVVMLGGFIPVDLVDSEPRLARFLQRLERFGRVVTFNRRGIGLSDPTSVDEPPTLRHWADDVLAVLDAVGATTTTIVAGLGDVKVAFVVAALAPDRVEQVISINGAVQPLTLVAGLTESALADRYRQDLRTTSLRTDDQPDQLAWVAPSMARDDSFRAWWISAGHRGASPSTARSLLQVLALADVTIDLRATTCPILVIQRSDSAALPVEAGRFIVRNSRMLDSLSSQELTCCVGSMPKTRWAKSNWR